MEFPNTAEISRQQKMYDDVMDLLIKKAGTENGINRTEAAKLVLLVAISSVTRFVHVKEEHIQLGAMLSQALEEPRNTNFRFTHLKDEEATARLVEMFGQEMADEIIAGMAAKPADVTIH